jgi:hypothetical protein
MRRPRFKIAHSNPGKSRILDRRMASPEQTIHSHRAGNRRFAGRQGRRIQPRPYSRLRFTAMCPAKCRSLAPGPGVTAPRRESVRGTGGLPTRSPMQGGSRPTWPIPCSMPIVTTQSLATDSLSTRSAPAATSAPTGPSLEQSDPFAHADHQRQHAAVQHGHQARETGIGVGRLARASGHAHPRSITHAPSCHPR